MLTLTCKEPYVNANAALRQCTCSMLTLTCKESYVNANAALRQCTCSMLTLTPHCSMLALTLRCGNAPAASVIEGVHAQDHPTPYSGNQGNTLRSEARTSRRLQWKSGVSYEPKATVEIKGKLPLDPHDRNMYKSSRQTENHLAERETE